MQPQPLLLPNYSSLGKVREYSENEQDLHEALIEDGWEELGNGCYCTAYLSWDGTRVLKIGCGYGQRATIEAALQHSDNPHLPKVYGFIDLGDGEFAAEVERLDDLRELDCDWVDDEDGWCDIPEPFAEWRRKWHPRKFAVNRDYFKGRPNGPMKDAVRALLAAQRKYGGNWDVHAGNVMVRPSTGELVLNDLIA